MFSSISKTAQSQPSNRLFRYSPLDTGYFRLLRVVHRGTDTPTCTLHHTRLNEAPDYYALSYVWGDELPDQELVVDDAVLYVTPHLLHAIQAIPFCDIIYRQELWLWIDAICIDQRSLQEKAVQVPLMGDVYACAECVIVWFGEPSDNEQTAIFVIEWFQLKTTAVQTNYDIETTVDEMVQIECRLAPRGILKVNLEALYEFFMAAKSDEKNFPLLDLRAISRVKANRSMIAADDELWEIIFEFVNNEWQRRIWTVQEIRLAENPVVLCGTSAIAWDWIVHIRTAFQLALLCGDCVGSMLSFRIVTRLTSGDMSSSNADFLTGPIEDERPPTFQWLLLGTWSRRAKCPKDYVYGLLGLVDESVRAKITVDYTESTSAETVFAQAIRAACESAESPVLWCELMRFLRHKPLKQMKCLPSWCPDFSADFDSEHELGRQNLLNISDSVFDKYQSLGYFKFPIDSNVAVVRGVRVDRVAEAIPRTLPVIDIPEALQSLDSLQRMEGVDQRSFDFSFNQKWDAWFTRIDSLLAVEGSCASTAPQWFIDVVNQSNRKTRDRILDDYLLARTICWLVASGNVRTPLEAQEALGISVLGLKCSMLLMSTLTLRVSRSYFFRTVAGRIGISANIIRPGDHICYIFGSRHLHYLTDNCSKYVSSEVFLAGLTGEKLLDVLPNEETEWEDFHLH